MDSSNESSSKKKIIGVIVIILMILAIPAAVILVQKTQIFKPKASVESITILPGSNITQAADGSLTTTSSTVSLQLNAGHPASQ